MTQKTKTTKTKKLHPGGSVPGGRGRLPIRAVQGKLTPAQRRRMKMMLRQRFQNPMMPTAGISQGRPVRGRTPMPGPAPNAEAMKRMQKLMREQQARFNKSRSVTPRPGMTRPPQNVIDQFRSGKIKTAAGEQLTLDQLVRRALRDRALGSKRKTLTPAQRKAASDARRRRNRPRTI